MFAVIVNSLWKGFILLHWIFSSTFRWNCNLPKFFLERPSWIWLISVKSFLSLSSYLFVSYSSIYFIRFSMNIYSRSLIAGGLKPSSHSPTYRVLICVALKRSGLIPCDFLSLVGSSGLEPPTSRLSGARSNHLSYEPIQFSVYLVLSRHWWRWWESNPWPPACRAGALPAELHPHIIYEVYWVSFRSLKIEQQVKVRRLSALSPSFLVFAYLQTFDVTATLLLYITFSIERRWSSRTFRYGYLVTT